MISFSIGVTAGQSAYLGGFGITKPTNVLNVELDVEKRMQADILKRQIRIKEFFHDFDRLRKGFVGEAGVSTARNERVVITWVFALTIVQDMPGNVKPQTNRGRNHFSCA